MRGEPGCFIIKHVIVCGLVSPRKRERQVFGARSIVIMTASVDRCLVLGSLWHVSRPQQIVLGYHEAHPVDVNVSIDGLLVTVPQH